MDNIERMCLEADIVRDYPIHKAYDGPTEYKFTRAMLDLLVKMTLDSERKRGADRTELEIAVDAAVGAERRRWAGSNGDREKIDSALFAAMDALERLRRGHGVEVGSICYPALNMVRELVEARYKELCRRLSGT